MQAAAVCGGLVIALALESCTFDRAPAAPPSADAGVARPAAPTLPGAQASVAGDNCSELAECCASSSDARLVDLCRIIATSHIEPACFVAAGQLCPVPATPAEQAPPTVPLPAADPPPPAAGTSAVIDAGAAGASAAAGSASQPPTAGAAPAAAGAASQGEAPPVPEGEDPPPPEGEAPPPPEGEAPPPPPGEDPTLAIAPCAHLADCCPGQRMEARRVCERRVAEADAAACFSAVQALRCPPPPPVACEWLEACCVARDNGQTSRCQAALQGAAPHECQAAYLEYCL